MASPRLMFVSLDRWSTWTLPGVELRPTSSQGEAWHGWRLLGGNNREIGRGARIFPRFQECYEDAAALRTRLVDAQATTFRDHDRNRWGWRVTLGGQLVAGSARLYQRQRECAFNLRQFVELLPVAVSAYDNAPGLVPVVDLITPELRLEPPVAASGHVVSRALSLPG